MELVSVLMPCRNAAPWIAAAIGSALAQTGCRRELIIVDDGSTDGSHEIARTFASARCRVVRQEPRGASAARNHALTLAQGDYIHYLDADDLLAPGKIARQLAALRGRGPLALSWSSLIYLPDGPAPSRPRREAAPLPAESGAAFLAQLWGADREPRLMAVHQWLATRDLIERAGPWDESLTVDDDGEFFARVVLRARIRLAVPQAHCLYRKFHHSENVSNLVRTHASHRRSALKAACLKAHHLLEADAGAASRRAVSRLLTQQIVDVYPDPAHRSGLAFLHHRGIPLADDVEAPPWFQRARPLIGWKAARRVQNVARRARSLRAALGRHDDAVGRGRRRVG